MGEGSLNAEGPRRPCLHAYGKIATAILIATASVLDTYVKSSFSVVLFIFVPAQWGRNYYSCFKDTVSHVKEVRSFLLG
jgi:hypothetical protein